MFNFIFLILAKPSMVKWALFEINSAAKVKSLKSSCLIVPIGYFKKKGIIILILSGKVFTTKSQAKPVDLM